MSPTPDRYTMPTDGLTPQAMASSSRHWWDETFTRLLLSEIPLDTGLLVELDCSTAAAAHLLLPSLPRARYLGIDPRPDRLAAAKQGVEQTRVADRVALRLGHAETLPVGDGEADVVLSVMALQHQPRTESVLREALRALRPGGRFVAAEPDNLSQGFYFDGLLEEVTRMFHDLTLRVRVARQPADIAIGPRLPMLARGAGYQHIRVVAHAVHAARMESASHYCDRLVRIAETLAREGDLPPDDKRLSACVEAVGRCRFAGLPRRVGTSCHLVPVFVVSATKP